MDDFEFVMKLEDAEKLNSRIDQEGFDYCFIHYSNFKEITCDEFHKLRLKYIQAHNELQEFIDKHLDINNTL